MESIGQGHANLVAFLANNKAKLIQLDRPIGLIPVAIEKPWGQEIWYTGIEQRGQSAMSADYQSADNTPLPWMLDLLPKELLGADQCHITLLKILDPLPEPVFGDLYFEMHKVKQEVYIVTHIDKKPWPTAIGEIRLGFNPLVIKEYNSIEGFKAAFLLAVKAYEKVRRQIDHHLDRKKRENNLPLNQAVAVKVAKQWLAELPLALNDQELTLRAKVERFLGSKAISLGDVIVIPRFTPHSLMHGVRTIEFQTPVYERSILYFAQKVLTQDHWDTQSSIDLMDCQPVLEPNIVALENNPQFCLDKVVDYPEFEVFKYVLQSHSSVQLSSADSHLIVIIISGELIIDGLVMLAEQACFIKYDQANQKLNTITNKLNNNATTFLVTKAK
jgi:hypothetical protein